MNDTFKEWNEAIADYKKVATKVILSSIEARKRLNQIFMVEEEEIIRIKEGK